jgi:hypothetical protein
MRRFLYIIFYPFVWALNQIFEWWYYFHDEWKKNGFKRAFKFYVINRIQNSIEDFFYDHHHNGVFGPGGRGWRTFKSGNLALLIAIITAIAFILYVILN